MKQNIPYKVLVSTSPFATVDPRPMELLQAAGCDVICNPHARKLTPDEMRRYLRDADALIAGTDSLGAYELEQATRLRVIARVGVGVDSIDFPTVSRQGITVTYTPNAPALAVAEFTLGLLLTLARHISEADRDLRRGVWRRYMGSCLRDSTVGIVGIGRIGRRVAQLLEPFGCRVLGHDSTPDTCTGARITWVDRETILRESDFLSLHLPLTPATYYWLDAAALELMPAHATLINTSRGAVVDEAALVDVLRSGRLKQAALDVYEREPYSGPLTAFDNVVLTSHMASATVEARREMELEAAEDCLRVLRGEPPLYPARGGSSVIV